MARAFTGREDPQVPLTIRLPRPALMAAAFPDDTEGSRFVNRWITPLLLAQALLLGTMPAGAVVSPSGVDWSGRKVLALVSDDVGSAEWMFSVSASTRWGLNVPWTGLQWDNVASALRGHEDRYGVQIPLTLYVVAAYMEPDFTPLTTDIVPVFFEPFNPPSPPGWSFFGTHPAAISSAAFRSAGTSLAFNTPTASADGWARRFVTQCKEYEVRFWVRLDTVSGRTHALSLTGPLGRSVGLEARSSDGRWHLREAFYEDEIIRPVAPYTLGSWQAVILRSLGGRIQVDLGADGSLEFDQPTAVLPTLATAVIVGDPSTTLYAGAAFMDDVLFTRYDNAYPASPKTTPIDTALPGVVDALRDNLDVFRIESHGWTHGNDLEVQRRYANGIVEDGTLSEDSWWREFYDAVNDRPIGMGYQISRLRLALDRLEAVFGRRPVVHVSPGNVWGVDTDTALEANGLAYHETRTWGGGEASWYSPGVFWPVRNASQELFYRQPDPNPLGAANSAAAQVESLFVAGAPAVLSTHSYNALVGGNGAALALYYDALLDTLLSRHPDLVAMSDFEMAQLERDGRSVSPPVGLRVYARNYLASPWTFQVPVDTSLVAVEVRRLDDDSPVAFSMVGGAAVFTAGPGDYVVELQEELIASVHRPGDAPPEAAGLDAWPVPAHPQVTLSARLPRGGAVSLEILDVRGRRVRTVHRGALAAGAHAFRWDGGDEDGGPAPAGMYVARLRWEGGEAHRKLLITR